MNLPELERFLYNKANEPRFFPGFMTGRESRVSLDHHLALRVLNTSGAAISYMQDAQQCGVSAITQTSRLIPIDNCDVNLNLLKPQNKLEVGDPHASGSMENDKSVDVYLYSSTPNFERKHTTRTQGVIAHELHHIVRERSVGIGNTLLEMLVDEGLALAFAEDYFDDKFEILRYRDITESGLTSFWNIAKAELYEKVYYSNWFGPFVPGNGLPDHVGYLLGYNLIRNYLRRHSGETSASLVNVPAERLTEYAPQLILS